MIVPVGKIKTLEINRNQVAVNSNWFAADGSELYVDATGGDISVYINSNRPVKYRQAGYSGSGRIIAPTVTVSQIANQGQVFVDTERAAGGNGGSVTGEQTFGPNNVATVKGTIVSWTASGNSNKLIATSCEKYTSTGTDNTCSAEPIEGIVGSFGTCTALAGADSWQCPIINSGTTRHRYETVHVGFLATIVAAVLVGMA